ncbi:MAG TPA: hypothetical protein VFJ80_11645 [Candidatus Limnocylindrales bacterium]|nr:hypothetical protein [Candidatus Limnocylindrales bacterium]
MTAAPGNIYDLGYRRYEGARLGRAVVALGLLGHTLREAYGIGRGGRAKITPFLLLILNALPALLIVGVQALANQIGAGVPSGPARLADQLPIRHDTYQNVTSTLVLLFCAAQAPELFGRDQRFGVLPLYFSRVLTRVDYALARTGGLFLAVLVVTIVPHLILTVGSLLTAADPLTGLADDLPDVPRYLAVSVLASGLLAGIAAVISAWTPRRAYATATIIGVFIVAPIVVALLSRLAVGDIARIAHLISPTDVVDGLNAAIFGTIAESRAVVTAALPGWIYISVTLVAIAGALALIVRRYLTVAV